MRKLKTAARENDPSQFFVTGWSVVLAAHFTGIKPLNALTLLSFLTVSAFDLVCLAGALRVLRRMKQEELGMGGTLAEALHASLQAVTRQMRDCRLFGWALAIEFTAELGGTLLFYWTGNLHGRGTVAKVVMLVLLMTAIMMTLRRYYRRQLVPRRAELQRELATLQNDPR